MMLDITALLHYRQQGAEKSEYLMQEGNTITGSSNACRKGHYTL
jgi:hypothetical protein